MHKLLGTADPCCVQHFDVGANNLTGDLSVINSMVAALEFRLDFNRSACCVAQMQCCSARHAAVMARPLAGARPYGLPLLCVPSGACSLLCWLCYWTALAHLCLRAWLDSSC